MCVILLRDLLVLVYYALVIRNFFTGRSRFCSE